MGKTPTELVTCINNTGYTASLTVGKRYQVLPDPDGDRLGMLRVIDDSGEDYLFEANRFAKVREGEGMTETIDEGSLVWNYRVVHWSTPMGKPYFSIHEVYYDDDGRPISCSVEPDYPGGNTLEELREDFEWYRQALDAPVLTEDDFTNDWKLDDIE